MSPEEELAASLQELEGAATLFWNGTPYPVSAGVLRRTVEPGQDGELEVLDTVRVIARIAVFGASAPKMRERVILDGRAFRVGAINKLRDGVYVLELVHSS